MSSEAYPRPWRGEWIGDNPPRVRAANGNVVCVVSTGRLNGAHDTDDILAVLAKAGGKP